MEFSYDWKESSPGALLAVVAGRHVLSEGWKSDRLPAHFWQKQNELSK